MTQQVRVLLVEDNPGDAELTRETLEAGRLSIHIDVVVDGAAAIAYLVHRDRRPSDEMPDLVILDLNLPKQNGREVLAELRNATGLERLPVVVLTSSEAERDVTACYELGANCYITKPVGLAAYQDTVRSIEEFWFSVARLPPRVN